MTTRDDFELSFAKLMTEYASSMTSQWDTEAQVPYLISDTPTGTLGCTYISHENSASILAKSEYLQKRDLGGGIIWNINAGYVPNHTPGFRDPFMEAVQTAFKWILKSGLP